jgi:hypothetical protein
MHNSAVQWELDQLGQELGHQQGLGQELELGPQQTSDHRRVSAEAFLRAERHVLDEPATARTTAETYSEKK